MAVDAAEAAVADAGLSDEVLGRVSLAVAEAVANAIEHGNDGEVSKRVRIDLLPAPERLDVTICDEGSGVEVDRVESAELPEDLLQTHGRGLFLIRVLTDECRAEAGCFHLGFVEREA